LRTLPRFVAEARRRKVFRTAGLYIVGAWVLLQVADLALESLELPSGLLRYFWLAAFAGLPLALIFGWHYDVTSEGISRTPPAGKVSPEDLVLKVPDYVIMVALAIVTGLVAAGIMDRARIEADQFDGGLAVLPLDNLSGEEGQDYFSAGMHDALITSLSKIAALRVVSRTSSMRIDRTLTMPQIASVLGVGHIVEGSVAREGNRVRIIIQLIDAAKDAHIWAESFERELTSVLTLQNEMAAAIARAVNVRLTDSEMSVLGPEEPVDPESFDRYLRGMHLINSGNNRVRRRGIKILETLVDEGAGTALVYAGLAYGYAQLGHSPYPEGMYPAARLAAQRALELDDSLAEAYLAVGMLKLYYEWDFPAAEATFRHAIELNPSLMQAHYHFAWLMELYRDSARSIPPGEMTIKLDPLSSNVRSNLGDQYRAAGLYDKALQTADEVLEMDPDNANAFRVKALTYLEQGDYQNALAMSGQIADSPLWGFMHGVVLAEAGRTDEAVAILDKIDKTPRNVVALLRLYAALGDTEEFFHWLGVAREARLPWYPWFLTWFPQIEQFQDDPRFIAMAEEIGLQDYL
jgi:TolB-like protein/Tfp pilus assembly protein PilF